MTGSLKKRQKSDDHYPLQTRRESENGMVRKNQYAYHGQCGEGNQGLPVKASGWGKGRERKPDIAEM